MDPTAETEPSPPSRTSRVMALVRRWLSAAVGLGLLIITLSGALLPHQGEILRSLNPTAYTHDADPGVSRGVPRGTSSVCRPRRATATRETGATSS